MDQACSVKMAGYWPHFFFTNLWTSTPSLSISMQKKNLANFQPSWPHTWSITHIITWLAPWAGKMNQIACCGWLPKLHLAHSGLPAVSRKQNFTKSHIINPLLTKLFGQDGWILASFFFGSLCTSTSSRSINTQKKNKANIQPSWPNKHVWSITHTTCL